MFLLARPDLGPRLPRGRRRLAAHRVAQAERGLGPRGAKGGVRPAERGGQGEGPGRRAHRGDHLPRPATLS